MATITEKSNGTYLIRIYLGKDGLGKPMQFSRIFKPSRPNLPYQYDEANLVMSGKSEEEAFRRGIAVGIRLMMEVTEYDDV